MSTIPARRLHNHRLEGMPLGSAPDVVGWLGAVQAQEYAHARWALALRLKDAEEAALEQLIDAGAILRTHTMRPTWHFVLRDDILWMQALTGPRVDAQNAGRYRQLELDENTLRRGTEIMAKALAGGTYLTRPELKAVLEQQGIPADGQRLAYIVMRAELQAVLCSGPRRGKQATYALVAERAPTARSLPRDEALALLVRRYFTSHGPAQVNDFVWWSGLTVADTRAGLDMNREHLAAETIGGKTYWQAVSSPVAGEAAPRAILAPPYDEYISYRDRGTIVEPGQAFPNPNEMYNGPLVIRGVILGTWRREFVGGRARVDVRPFRPLTSDEHHMLAAAADRYGDYLGMATDLTV